MSLTLFNIPENPRIQKSDKTLDEYIQIDIFHFMSFLSPRNALRLAVRDITPAAGPSSIVARTPQCNRYLAIHTFFTRQASFLTQSLGRTPPAHRKSPHALRSNSVEHSRRQLLSTPRSDTPFKVNFTSNNPGHSQEYTPFIRRLIRQSGSLAENPSNRPTKDELLAVSESWWERLRIRLRWFTIRGWRRFNTDDMSAFASMFVMGNSA